MYLEIPDFVIYQYRYRLVEAKSVSSRVFPEMTLLSSQPKPLEPASVSDATPAAGTEDPELRMLEKRSKVIEELLQTEKDYIKDLQMCVEEIIEPLQKKQVRRCCKYGVAELNHVRASR